MKKVKAPLIKESCMPELIARGHISEKITQLRHQSYPVFSLRFLAAALATKDYHTAYNRLLESDLSIKGGCSNGQPCKQERQQEKEWREKFPKVADSMESRGITPRQWLAAYGFMIENTKKVNFNVLLDPRKYEQDYAIVVCRYLEKDFPEAFGIDPQLDFYNFKAIHGAEYATKSLRRYRKNLCNLLTNKELNVEVKNDSLSKAQKTFRTRIYQEVIIHRLDMLLKAGKDEDTLDQSTVRAALHWLPKKAAITQQELDKAREAKELELKLLLSELEFIKHLRVEWATLYGSVFKTEFDSARMEEINVLLKNLGVEQEMVPREKYQAADDIPRPHYQNEEIDDFWVKYLASGKYTLEKAPIQAIQEILFLLDAEGECPSVVDHFNFEKDHFSDKTSYALVKKVPLWRHTLNVAELMATPQKDDSDQDVFNRVVIRNLIVGLIHDLGKLPSIHEGVYATGDHPITFQLALKRHCPTFMTLYNYDLYAMPVKGHHAPGGNKLTKLLKEMDSEARKIELCKATKK